MKKILTYTFLALAALTLSSCASKTEARSGYAPLTPTPALGNYCGGDR
jgi:hypothetical protein